MLFCFKLLLGFFEANLYLWVYDKFVVHRPAPEDEARLNLSILIVYFIGALNILYKDVLLK